MPSSSGPEIYWERRAGKACAFSVLVVCLAMGLFLVAKAQPIDRMGFQTRNDHYNLRVTASRVSKHHVDTASQYRQFRLRDDVQIGPLAVEATLVPAPPPPANGFGLASYLDDYLPILNSETEKLENDKTRFAQILALPAKDRDRRLDDWDRAFMDAIPDLERRLKAARAHSEDVRLLLRLLTGVQAYNSFSYASYRVACSSSGGLIEGAARGVPDAPRDANWGQKFAECAEPYGDPMRARLSGADWSLFRQSVFGNSSTTETAHGVIDSWELDDVEGERPNSLIVKLFNTYLIVWRFEPQDLARVRRLLAELESIKHEMANDDYPEASWKVPTGKRPNSQDAVANRNINYNQRFWFSFRLALTQVVAVAWMMSPQEPPQGIFKKDWTLTTNAPLTLPPISGRTLMRVTLRANILPDPVIKPATTELTRVSRSGGKTSTDTQEVELESSVFRYKTGTVRSRLPLEKKDADTSYRIGWHDDQNNIAFIAAEGAGMNFRGGFRAVWQEVNSEYRGQKGKEFKDDRVELSWELEHVGPNEQIAPGAGEGARP